MPWLWIYLIGFLISLRFCAQEFYHLPDSGKATDIKTYHNVLKSYFMRLSRPRRCLPIGSPISRVASSTGFAVSRNSE